MSRDDPGVLGDTTFVRFLATLLIANSHLEAFYPRRWMAADGMIGGTMFFTISGFSLLLSMRRKQQPFLQWYWRRITRLYPSIYIVVAAFSVLLFTPLRYAVPLVHVKNGFSPLEILKECVWPTSFGFIQAIMVLYILLYFIIKVRDTRFYLLLMGMAAGGYLYIYLPDAMQMAAHERLSLGGRPGWVSHFALIAALVLGVYMAASPRRARMAWRDALLLGVCLVVYVAAKFAMVMKGVLPQAYPMLHVLTMLIIYYLFMVSRAPLMVKLVRDCGWVSRVIGWIGALTLEIYIVHELFIGERHVRALRFPLNVAAFWALTIPCAAAVERLAAFIRGRLRPSAAPAPAPRPQLQAAGR